MRKFVLVLVALALAGPTWADKARDGTKSLMFTVKQLDPAGADSLRANVKKVPGVASAIVDTKEKTVTVTLAPGKTVAWTELAKAVQKTNEKWTADPPTAAIAGKFKLHVSGLTEAQAKNAAETLAAYKATEKATHQWDEVKGTTFDISFHKGKNLKFSTIWSAFTGSGGKQAVAQPKLNDAWFYAPVPPKKGKKKG